MGYHNDLQGLDLHAPSNFHIENDTGSALTQLKVVKYTGFGTTFPEVSPITSISDSPAGIMPLDLADGADGFTTAIGYIFDCDTSAWVAGQVLYADASGDLTAVVNDLRVAIVIKADASTGILFSIAVRGAKGDTGAPGAPGGSGSTIVFSDYFIGVTSDPETTATDSASAPVIDEMEKTFTPADAGNKIEVFFSGTFGENSTNKDETCHIGIFVDGSLRAETERAINVKKILEDDKLGSVSTQLQVSLSAVPHTIDVRMWIEGAGGATLRAMDIRRSMFIRETDE